MAPTYVCMCASSVAVELHAMVGHLQHQLAGAQEQSQLLPAVAAQAAAMTAAMFNGASWDNMSPATFLAHTANPGRLQGQSGQGTPSLAWEGAHSSKQGGLVRAAIQEILLSASTADSKPMGVGWPQHSAATTPMHPMQLQLDQEGSPVAGRSGGGGGAWGGGSHGSGGSARGGARHLSLPGQTPPWPSSSGGASVGRGGGSAARGFEPRASPISRGPLLGSPSRGGQPPQPSQMLAGVDGIVVVSRGAPGGGAGGGPAAQAMAQVSGAGLGAGRGVRAGGAEASRLRAALVDAEMDMQVGGLIWGMRFYLQCEVLFGT